MTIRWIEVEPSNGGLISAAASVSNGYRQLMADKIIAILYIKKHLLFCSKCNQEQGIYCEKGQALFKEIGERLGEYGAFLKTMNNFQKMYETFGPIVEDGYIEESIKGTG